MLLIRERDVQRLLPMREAIRLMREAFQGLASGNSRNQPRRRLALPGGSVLHSMAGAHGHYFGTKIYTTHPDHGAHFLFLLCHSETGKPAALFEANYLGQIRTGAVTGLATDLLARPDATAVGMIGSGFQARTQLEAVLAVRPVSRVRVWSRKSGNRERFAGECAAEYGLAVEVARSPEEAVSDAGIVVTATYAKEPVVRSEWIADGAHVNAVGSNNPTRRELPDELIQRAQLIVVDSWEQSKIEAGDLLLALNPSEWESLPLSELSAVVAGQPLQRRASDVTIFKSNGLGVEDVAAAAHVYERAKAEGTGAVVDWFYS